MKKIKLVFLLLTCFLSQLFAQKDTTNRFSQERQRYFSDSVTIAAYNFAKSSPLFIDGLMPKQISTISLGYQLEKGKFVAAQGSTNTNTAFLSSEGAATLKGIKLFGAFYYKKVFEDSTRFAHQSRNNTTTPYYFGSPKNNHYERAIYDFKVLAAKDIVTKRLTAGAGFDYHIADHFANNDPRGSLKEYQLNAKASLAYHLNRIFEIGIGYLIGYGQEKVTIGYKNRIYYESLSQPEYVNYLINGYGEPTPKTGKRNYNDFQNRSGLEASIVAKNTKFGSFYLIGSQIREKQVYDYRTSEEITDLSHYNIDKLSINFLWAKALAKGNLITNFNYQNIAGDDFNLNYFAKNYVYTANQLQLTFQYALTSGKTNYNYKVGVKQRDEEKIDGITGNKVFYKNAIFDAAFGVNRQLRKSRSVGFNVGAHFGHSMDDQFAVSSANENYFTRYVIFHDYLYQTASLAGGSLNTNYSFPFFKSMQAALALNFVYTQNTGMRELKRTLITKPGKDRYYTNISFNLYF